MLAWVPLVGLLPRVIIVLFSERMNLYDEFEWRSMLYEATPDLRDMLAKEKVTAYIGFDPSAPSLHVGSLLPVMGLARLQRFGHTPIAIAGGGTGLIGDPSGKTKERQLLDHGQVEENLAGIKEQLSRFLDFDAKENPAHIVNNADWLGPITMMEFLRDVGKHFTVNNLLGKEAISRRLESEEGISFTEFTYPAVAGLRLSRASRSLQVQLCKWAEAISGETFLRASI